MTSKEPSRIEAKADDELMAALRAAWQPREIDPARHAEILAGALEDPLAPPTTAELVDSVRLRDALEGTGEHPGAELAGALRSGWDPERLRRGEMVTRVLASSNRGRLIRVTFGSAAAALALAAGVALVVGIRSRAPNVAMPSMVASRTTASLFSSKFSVGSTSGRLDAIALARSRDLRQNRFSGWGIE
jgi:hypothetical protein